MTVDAPSATSPPGKDAAPAPSGRRGVRLLKGLAAVLGALVLAAVLFLWLVNWNMLRGPISRFASAHYHRHVEINGDLRVHLLTWTPSVSVEGIKIAEPAWAGAGDMADIRRLVVSIRLAPLLTGRVILPLFELDHADLNLFKDAQGRANWEAGPPKPNAPALRLPPIEHFILNQARIHYADAARRLEVRGIADSNEAASGPLGHAFSLTGEGLINTAPFHVAISGGPLLHVDVDKPYPFHIDIQAGTTRAVADGELAKPFDTSNSVVRLKVNGEDLANLYYLTGLALPNTPPYAFAGRLSHHGAVFAFDDASGRFGSSDVEGGIKVTTVDRRPLVEADLRSKVLDLKDLASLLGARPSAPVGGARPSAPSGRLLPDAPLDASRLKGMDARLTYRAGAVNSGFLPIRAASLKLALQAGVLELDPISFSFPQGRVTGSVRIDANLTPPLTRADIRFSNLNLDELIPQKGPNPPIEGLLAARIKIEGRGASVHRAAAASSGAATFVVPHGEMRQAFAELLGVNAGKGLSMLLSKNKGDTGLRCAVADFGIEGGMMRARNLVVDTDVVKVEGSGQINLGAETLDLVLKGDTKRFRIGHVFLPITLRGTLLHPEIGVQPGPAVAQGAAAAALGVVFTPLAAVIPFVDPGLAKNADCAALMGEAKSAPAAVAPAQAHGLAATPDKRSR